MTATQIMREIDLLPPREQSKVVRFARDLDARRQLSGDELNELAQRMVDASDPLKADCLKEEIIKGFYGGE